MNEWRLYDLAEEDARRQAQGMTQDGRWIAPIEGDPPCGEYDPAGSGAGLEEDGWPQCAACGHQRSRHQGEETRR